MLIYDIDIQSNGITIDYNRFTAAAAAYNWIISREYYSVVRNPILDIEISIYDNKTRLYDNEIFFLYSPGKKRFHDPYNSNSRVTKKEFITTCADRKKRIAAVGGIK